jgi:hypothetical protein
MDINEELFETALKVQELPEAPTLILPAALLADTAALDGVNPNTQPLSWLMVNGRPAMVSVTLRGPPEFAWTV